MNTGSQFSIGKSHRVCQDYCESGLIGKFNAGYAIVSDGCSSSPDTDFGARFLTKIYAKYPDWIETTSCFEDSIMYAEKYIKDLELSPYALDATLLTAYVRNDEYKIYVTGDGVFAKIFDDHIEVTTIEYTSGAPFYLSYHLDNARKKLFIDMFSLERVVRRFKIYSDGVDAIDVTRDSNGEVYLDQGSKAGLTAICLMSDGVQSFYKMVDTGPSKAPEPVGLPDVLRELLSFKGFQGEFVARRMQRFAKDCEKLGWHHADDLSLAVIAINQEG